MAQHESGYDGWKDLDMSEQEEQDFKTISKALERDFDAAFPEHKGTLKIAFTKASLTISEEEYRTGAFHSLAGGEPFFRLAITGGSLNEATHPATIYVTCMMQLLVNGTLTMSEPLKLSHDFREDMCEKGLTLMGMSDAAIAHIKKETIKPS